MSAGLVPLCVAVLNYNRRDLVLKCAQSFKEQSVLPEKILFIDNGSQDFDEAWVRTAFGPRIEGLLEFLLISENLGYSQAFNKGLRTLLHDANASSWVMTLSNDTELAPDFFEKMAMFLRENAQNLTTVGMLSPKVRSLLEREKIDSTGIAVCLDGMSSARGQNEIDRGQYDLAQVLVPSGVSAIYKLDMLEDIGLMDESFQAYCEDIDLGLRAWVAGWECRMVAGAIVYHMRSATYGNSSLTKLYLVERNHFWVALKNFPFIFLLFLPVSTLYRYLLQVMAYFLKRGRVRGFTSNYSLKELVRTTLWAFRDAFYGMPRAWEFRKENAQKRRRSIFEIVHTYWKLRLRFKDLLH